MCRMIIYKGLGIDNSILLCDLIVKPKHSIIKQSYNCQERFHNTGLPPQINADGFGIGWFAEGLYTRPLKHSLTSHKRRCSSITAAPPRNTQFETPCVFTSVSPAWNNQNLFRLADKIRSPLFFAHVRAASLGSATNDANCHPFTWDRYLWMHNGGVADFIKIKRNLLSSLSERAFQMMTGSTDSEHCFALFLTKLESIGCLADEFSAEQLQQAMTETISQINIWCREAGIEEPSLLNFAVTDGRSIVACRYVNSSTSQAASLYLTSGTRWIESTEYPGEYFMQRADKRERVVIIASERLSTIDEDWVEVPKNHMVVINSSMSILITPIDSEDQ